MLKCKPVSELSFLAGDNKNGFPHKVWSKKMHQQKNKYGDVQTEIRRGKTRKSQNTVDSEDNCSLSSAVFVLGFDRPVCGTSSAMLSGLLSFSVLFTLAEETWITELGLVAFGMLSSSQESELCSLLASSSSSVTCGLILNLGALQFLSTWLYMLATDLSMSARFWMFFRIPLSSFFLPTSVCDCWGRWGCFRSETGRREDTGGREAGTNWTTGRNWSLAGEGGGGRGGGVGGETCLSKAGEGWGVGVWRLEGNSGEDGGLEGGDVGGEGGRCCCGGGGGGFSGGSGMISTVIWQGWTVMQLDMLELNRLRTGGVDLWPLTGHDSSPWVMTTMGGPSLPTPVELWV